MSRFCVKCGGEFVNGVCPKCGNTVSAQEQLKQESCSTQCPNCNVPYNNNGICPRCGSKKVDKGTEQNKKTNNYVPIALIIALIALIGLIVLYVVDNDLSCANSSSEITYGTTAVTEETIATTSITTTTQTQLSKMEIILKNAMEEPYIEQYPPAGSLTYRETRIDMSAVPYDSLNIRAGEGDRYSLLTTVPDGTKIVLIYSGSRDYSYIYCESVDKYGWILSCYIA